ncbi:hypothetical protein GIB67_021159, partial [Kingdonia uniflora]
MLKFILFFSGNNSLSNASSKKKRGSKPLPNEKKKKIGVNLWGQPNQANPETNTYSSDIGFHVCTHLLIIYESFKDVPNDLIALAVKGLEAKSKKNKENRAKLIALYTLGRTSMPITRHKLDKESGITDDEIGRVEVYIIAHSKKNKTIQCHDVITKLQNTMQKDAKSIQTGHNDAIAQKFGKKRKGGTRGMGAGMSISLVEKVGHIVNENEELRSNNDELKFATEKLRNNLDALTKYVGNIPVSYVFFKLFLMLQLKTLKLTKVSASDKLEIFRASQEEPELYASRQAGLLDFIASALPASHTSKPKFSQ